MNHALIDKKMFVLGYVPQKNRIFLVNKTLKITSYELLTSVIEAQQAIVKTKEGTTTADPEYEHLKSVIDEVPENHISKIAKFLESMNHKEIAYHVTIDEEHKFDLAISLNKIRDAHKIALKDSHNEEKLRKIGDISLKVGDFNLAEECYRASNDFNSLLLLYSSLGDEEGMDYVATKALEQKKYNIAYQCYFGIGNPEKCYEVLLAADKIPEAAMFARAYIPSKLFSVMEIWKKKVEDKPYVPTSLSDIPDNLTTIDLAIRIEGALKEYYSQEKPSAAQYDAAFNRHFQEISQQVETGVENELSKPLFLANEVNIVENNEPAPEDPSPISPEEPALASPEESATEPTEEDLQ